MDADPLPFAVPPASRRGSGAHTFAALRHRDFRLFWAGLLLSLTGGWMQQVAGPWLVYRLTDSALMLGLVGFLAAVPAAPLSLIAGPLVDRLPRRPLLIATQVALMLPPIALAWLAWTGKIEVWHIVVAELLRGAAATIDQPAKQVAIVEMTGREDVSSAIALWTAAINVARIVGPLLAGLLVAASGEALCFLLNGLSYLAVVGALLLIRLPAPAPAARRLSLAGSAVDGWKYLAKERLLVVVASLGLAAGVFVRPFQTLLPVLARDVLLAGATGLGFLTAAAGAGSLLGALGAASLRLHRQQPWMLFASLALPVAVAGFCFSRSLLLACLMLVVVGGLLTMVETLSNALVLAGARDEYRGRVMGLYMAAGMGAPKVGGLQAGWLATLLGAPLALGVGAAAALAYSVAAVGLIRANKLGRQPWLPPGQEPRGAGVRLDGG
ncbi:MAG TPA: MFS transporter [Anaerolineae bacterium]|nr:MFS transporter [Anaerolineae bacterium]